MIVALPFCRRDSALALANLRWIAEMGHVSAHEILLVVDEGVDYSQHQKAAESCFKSVRVETIFATGATWPISQNYAWKRAVDYIDHFKLYPFLYLESDAIAIYPEWLNDIASEYSACGQPFMGYLEYSSDPERKHMNGSGVYGDIQKFAPSALTAPIDEGPNRMAFDWAGKDEIVPQMHVSPLFQFQYKKEAELLKDESLSWLKPETAIFHTCKDVRLIELLRARRNGTPAPLPPRRPTEATSSPLPFSCDIFIKTYAKVAPWHAQALRSIDRFCTGFRKTVVVGDQPVEGYQEMQVVKLNADLYTDADYILTTDSDTLFAVDVTPQTYFRDGKSIWLHRSWESALAKEGDAVMRWHRGMEKFFGVEPPREFMCRHPEMLPRWLYSAFRIFCQLRHGKTMEEWVLADKDFADWNMLGMYAWLYHREAFCWIDDDAETLPLTVKQFWGGHEYFDKQLPETERILAGGGAGEHVPPGPVQRSPETKHSDPKQVARDRMAKARAAIGKKKGAKKK